MVKLKVKPENIKRDGSDGTALMKWMLKKDAKVSWPPPSQSLCAWGWVNQTKLTKLSNNARSLRVSVSGFSEEVWMHDFYRLVSRCLV
jgi:hypothetical protein